ncbi:RraA family protein [Pirellulales bacterium]|nr:RraA family protein [Pirellulales bacterium]
MASPEQLPDALAKYDTATICNVIELFDVRPRNLGFMDHRIYAAFPELPPMVGYAFTACYRSAAPAANNAAYATFQEQLEQISELPAPAIVAFQDLDDPPVGATFGEVMCSIYQSRGVAGLITSGAGRDLPQIRQLKFPVFQAGTICSHAYGQLVDLGRPVRIGSLPISTGQLLHGDANGVTDIPLEIADELPDVAREFIAAEQKLINFAKSSSDVSIEQVSEQQQELAAAVNKLKLRVSRSITS